MSEGLEMQNPDVPSYRYTGVVRLAFATALCGLMIASLHAQQRKMIRVDDSFDGREVKLQVGETLEVSLSENASTGHRWSISPELKRKLTPTLRETDETVDASSRPPGNSGVRHLYFEGVSAGTAELEIEYRRSWENHKPPARGFKLHVLVQSPPGR
jgi:predicted secreted protein